MANVKSFSIRCVAVASGVVGLSGFAADSGKSVEYAKPGLRSDAGAPVRVGESIKSFWAAIEDNGKTVKAAEIGKKSRRAAMDEGADVLKPAQVSKAFWKAVDEDSAPLKTGSVKKSRPALGESPAAEIQGRGVNRDR